MPFIQAPERAVFSWSALVEEDRVIAIPWNVGREIW